MAADLTLRQFTMDVNDVVFFNQCQELARRYWDMKRPLGPDSVLQQQPGPAKKKEKKGKKNRRGKSAGGHQTNQQTGWKTHDEEITSRLTKLLTTIHAQLLPSNSTAEFVVDVASMLVAATGNDLAVSRALVDDCGSKCGSLLIGLRSKALARAKESKSKSWWRAYKFLTDALGDSARAFFPKRYSVEEEIHEAEDSPASSFFFKRIVPILLPSMESSLPEERGPAFC